MPRYHVLHLLPDLNTGGGTHLLLRNASRLSRQHFRQFICHIRADAPMHQQFADARLKTFSLDVDRPMDLVGAAYRLKRFIDEERIDLIHTNNTRLDRRLGEWMGRLCSIPVINTLHAMPGSQPRPWLHQECRRLYNRFASRAIVHVVAVSDSTRLAWQDELDELGLQPDQISIIPPGVDMATFPQDGMMDRSSVSSSRAGSLPRDLPGLADAGPILVNVARLVRGKGHHDLLFMQREMLRRWPNAKLLLIGDGPLRRELAAKAADLGLQSHVIFAADRADVPSLLALADLFVFASCSEGFGMAVVEAMAAALPVVAYDLPALREFIENGRSGLLTPLGDTAALTQAAHQLLSDRSLAARMGRRGRAIVVERFDVQGVAQQWSELYLNVIERYSSFRAAMCPAAQS